MKEVTLQGLGIGGSQAGGESGYLELQTSEGPQRLVFSDEQAEHMIFALRSIQGSIAAERRKVGKPVVQHRLTVPVVQREFGVDAVNQVAVITTRFANGYSQDTPIGRDGIQDVQQFLARAMEQFAAMDRGRRQ